MCIQMGLKTGCHCWQCRYLTQQTHECVLCQQRGELSLNRRLVCVCVHVCLHVYDGYIVQMATCYMYVWLLRDVCTGVSFRSSSTAEGLFSSLYLLNKPETYSFGVRPASLMALITELGSFSLLVCSWAHRSGSRVCENLTRAMMRYKERDCTAARYTKTNKGILWHFEK